MIRSFFRNAGVIAAAEMLSRLKGLVFIPLLTHRLGAVNYGVWAQVAVLVALFGPVLILGTDSAVIRYLPGTDRTERTRRFAGWILAVAMCSVVLCALVALLKHPLAMLAFGTGGDYERFIPLAAAAIMATIFLNFARTWYRLENDALRLSTITVGQAIFSTVALVLFLSLHRSLYDLVLYTIIGDALLAIFLLISIERGVGGVRPDFSLLPQLVRYGLPLLPAGYAIWALNWLDRIFVVHYDDLKAVGIYSLAYSLGYLAIQLVVNPVWTMFPNAFAELWNLGRREEAQRLFESIAGMTLALTAPAIVGTVVFGDGLLRILAPPQFAPAAPVIPIVLAGYLCFMLSAFYETAFGLVDRQVLGAVTVGVASLVNLALNFALIPPFSYTGAAVATLAAFAVQLTLCLWLNRRLTTLRTPWEGPVRIGVASIAMGAALLPTREIFVGHGAPALIGGVLVGAVVYAALCRLLGVLRPGVTSTELRRLFRRPARAAQV